VRVTRSSLTLLNISFTSATITPPLLSLLVHNTPSMHAFYSCGRSLPHDCARAHEVLQWPLLHTLSIGCQQRSSDTLGINGHSLQVRVLYHIWLWFWCCTMWRACVLQLVGDSTLLRLLPSSLLLLHIDLSGALQQQAVLLL